MNLCTSFCACTQSLQRRRKSRCTASRLTEVRNRGIYAICFLVVSVCVSHFLFLVVAVAITGHISRRCSVHFWSLELVSPNTSYKWCVCECVNEKKGTEKKNKVDERWWRTSFAALFTRQSICVKMIFFELKSQHNIGQMICWSSFFFGAFNRMSTHPRPHFNGFFSLMNWSLFVHREYNWCYSLKGEWESEWVWKWHRFGFMMTMATMMK